MGSKGKILLVDDDPDVLSTVRDVLELEGYEIETAENGFVALKAATQSPFDAVLMDVRMPGLDGVQTFIRFKEIAPGTPVIMVTAYSEEDIISDALREGAFAAMRKPLDFDQLFKTIEEARGKGAMVLVVDDDDELCGGMKLALDSRNFRTKVAGDGETALKLTRENNFDIIILDMKLPTLNGFETYLEIKKIRPNAVVILITGAPGEMLELARKAVERSAYVCLQKPVQMDSLVELMDRIMEQKAEGRLHKP